MSLVEFNEWYGDKGEKLHIYRDEKWIAKHGFEAGQQSQQGEVDKLKTEIDELQARVVELTKAMSEVQMMSHKSISYEHDLFDKGWNQASKQVVINIHRLTGIGEGLLK